MKNVNGIEITDLIISPVKHPKPGLRAFAKIIINDQLLINGVQICEGKDGLFITYPKQETFEAVSPLTAELRAYLADAVLSQYYFQRPRSYE